MTADVTPPVTPAVSLSGQLASQVTRDVQYDISIGGVPFRVAPSQQDPLLHDLRSSEKEQFDSSQQAGENSFGDWWLRSQSTFHAGAGQRYLDSGDNTDITRARFETSTAAYPHEAGELTIAGQLTSNPTGRAMAVQTEWATVPKLVTASNSTNAIYASTLPALTSTTTITLGASGVPAAMCTDGINVWVAIADKIYRVDSAGVAVNTHTIVFSGPVVLGFAKQRLILCVGNKVYELDPNPSVPPVAVGAAHYTNPSSNYIYTSVREGPNGIYLSGYSGPASDVSVMSVTESAGTLVLGPATVQLRLPPRERVNDVFFYVGSLFALATSNGARVGSFTPYGQPQMGSLLIRDVPCSALTGDGTLIYVGAEDSVWWIDLATPTDQVGGYAYARAASGVGATSTDSFTDIEVYEGLVFGATAGGQLVAQPTYAPDEATLTTSWSRFGTTEPKRLHYVTVEGEFPVIAGIDAVATVQVENAEGDTVTFNVSGGADNFEFSCQGLPASQAFRLHFTLRDNGTGHGVLLRSWQLKARPAPARFPEVTLPLQCLNTETTPGGDIGYNGYAKDRYLALSEMARKSLQVTVQDRLLGISYQAEISRAQFRQDVGPGSATQFGGTLNVILKQV